MTGDELRSFRERRGLSRAELAELMNDALGKNYNGESIGRWERGKVPVSKQAATFLGSLIAQDAASGLEGLADGLAGDGAAWEPPTDTPPGAAPTDTQPLILTGGSMWTKACTEMWELVASGVGMVGGVLGNESLVSDGAIIYGDREALGAAWGKLAETNETLRRMITGATEGGAWVQVILVTGTTFSKCYQQHAARAHERRQTQGYRDEQQPDDELGVPVAA